MFASSAFKIQKHDEALGNIVRSALGENCKNQPHTRQEVLVCWLDGEVFLYADISGEKDSVMPGIHDVCVAKCSFLTKNLSMNMHIHTHYIPGVDSRGGEQEAAQAAVGVAFTFNLWVTVWEGLNDLHKGLWEYTSLIVHSALKRRQRGAYENQQLKGFYMDEWINK